MNELTTAGALAFGIVCLAVGFVSGAVIAAGVAVAHPGVKTMWAEYRAVVDRRRALQQAAESLAKLAAGTGEGRR